MEHQIESLEEIVGLGNAAGPNRLDKIEKRLESLPDPARLEKLESVIQFLLQAQEQTPKPETQTRLPRATKRQPKTEGETP